MVEPFIGEIRIFAGTFAPEGWLFCNGQSLPISKYTPLFAIIGAKYGGDGRKNFLLPDLRGRVPIGRGQGPGLTNQTIGKSGGINAVTLNPSQIPSHTHSVNGTNAKATSSDPAGRIWAKATGTSLYATTNNSPVPMSANVLGVSGSSSIISHNNVQPCLGINFIIAWGGVSPI